MNKLTFMVFTFFMALILSACGNEHRPTVSCAGTVSGIDYTYSFGSLGQSQYYKVSCTADDSGTIYPGGRNYNDLDTFNTLRGYCLFFDDNPTGTMIEHQDGSSTAKVVERTADYRRGAELGTINCTK